LTTFKFNVTILNVAAKLISFVILLKKSCLLLTNTRIDAMIMYVAEKL